MLDLKPTEWNEGNHVYGRFFPVPATYKDENNKVIEKMCYYEEVAEGLSAEQATMVKQVLNGIENATITDPVLRLHLCVVVTNAFGHKLAKIEIKSLRRDAKHYLDLVKQEHEEKVKAERDAREAVHFGSDDEIESIGDSAESSDDGLDDVIFLPATTTGKSSSSGASSSGNVKEEKGVKKERKVKKEKP
jgi:hypothetical protein